MDRLDFALKKQLPPFSKVYCHEVKTIWLLTDSSLIVIYHN